MTKLIFITHPGVVIDKDTPIDQWPLSPKGLEEAAVLAEKDFWSSVGVIYSSLEPKAITVAEVVAGKGGFRLSDDFKQDALGEIRHRTFIEPGKFPQAVADWYAHPSGHPNGWESVAEAQKRIVAGVTALMEKNRDRTVVIIGHGGTGTLLMCYIKGVKPSFKDDPLTTGCMAVYDWDEKKVISSWVKY